MIKVALFKSWILTNVFGSISIVLIVFLANLFFDQIDFDSRRVTQMLLGIFIFFLFGVILTLPHFLYANSLIRKKFEPQKLWNVIRITMGLLYALILLIVVSCNTIIYGNPIYELPNFLFLGILGLHFIVGFFVWRYFLRSNILGRKSLSSDKKSKLTSIN